MMASTTQLNFQLSCTLCINVITWNKRLMFHYIWLSCQIIIPMNSLWAKPDIPEKLNRHISYKPWYMIWLSTIKQKQNKNKNSLLLCKPPNMLPFRLFKLQQNMQIFLLNVSLSLSHKTLKGSIWRGLFWVWSITMHWIVIKLRSVFCNLRCFHWKPYYMTCLGIMMMNPQRRTVQSA